MDLEVIRRDVRRAAEGLLEAAALQPGQVLVVGCSTSEVIGRRIGTATNLEVARAILEPLLEVTHQQGVYLAVQGCEHINRALVVESAAMGQYNLEQVSVYPVPGAGGALAFASMDRFRQPVVVEAIQAHAGMDIGDTFIGMHLRRVAVPVRLEIEKIGAAHLTMARTRPKLIGGERARYRRPDGL
ncbi:MAG: TIGR01440 family protein [Firmicutes bacterium]|nr:TIGR01440 family protein [Bacillota bacterium]MCL5039937.1 TIGR01440 family protein [Bacillota bacterium]